MIRNMSRRAVLASAVCAALLAAAWLIQTRRIPDLPKPGALPKVESAKTAFPWVAPKRGAESPPSAGPDNPSPLRTPQGAEDASSQPRPFIPDHPRTPPPPPAFPLKPGNLKPEDLEKMLKDRKSVV